MPIFDQGYQHWQGDLAGHGWRWLAVTRHGIRTGMQNRYLRLLLLSAWVPSFVLAGVVCLWGMVEDPSSWAARLLRSSKPLSDLMADPKAYRATAWTIAFHIFLRTELYFSMVVVLLVGPGLISQDLRFNALPLYFSRPVRRIDYFLGKLGVIGFFLGLVTVLPAVAAWLLGVLVSLDPGVIPDTYRLLLAMIVYGVVVTLSAGLLMLALSSLTRNSRYVAVIWAGLWLLTFTVSSHLEDVHQKQMQRHYFVGDAELNRISLEIAALQAAPRAADGQQNPQERLRLREQLGVLERERDRRGSLRWSEGQAAYEKALNEDWRPLLSYTGNLQRIGYALLGSSAAWDKVDLLRRARFQANFPPGTHFAGMTTISAQMAPPYPWYWSALVLLALACVSVAILNWRVRSLDRLR